MQCVCVCVCVCVWCVCVCGVLVCVHVCLLKELVVYSLSIESDHDSPSTKVKEGSSRCN